MLYRFSILRFSATFVVCTLSACYCCRAKQLADTPDRTATSSKNQVECTRQTDMSLPLSHSTLSRREKQEMFKKSLDDQLRVNQEVAPSAGHHVARANSGRFVSGVESCAVPGLNRIPGLDNHQHGGGYAPRFEGGSPCSPSPRQQQPYMSAVSRCCLQGHIFLQTMIPGILRK